MSLNNRSEISSEFPGTLDRLAHYSRVLKCFRGNERGIEMTKFGYALAALAAVAIVTPSIAQDKPKADITVKQDTAPGGEVKRDEGKREEGRAPVGGEMRRDGERDRGGMRVEGRGEGREMGRVDNKDRGDMRGERRWHRAHAERVVIIHRRHRHHHYDHHHHEM